MTHQPYTDADLRHEAARQHAACAWDPDFMGVGEAMENEFVKHTIITRPVGDRTETAGMRWAALLPFAADDGEAYNEAQRKIHDLINGAADVSAWAVQLGADGLVPSTEHAVSIDAGRPIARIHFAFEPGMPEEMRTGLVTGVGHAIDRALEGGGEETDAEDSDADVFDLIGGIASKLRDATDSGEYHAVGLIYDLAMGRTTVAEARAELAGIEFGHV